MFATRFRCVSITPFGSPVVPLEYGSATRSWAGSIATSGGSPPAVAAPRTASHPPPRRRRRSPRRRLARPPRSPSPAAQARSPGRRAGVVELAASSSAVAADWRSCSPHRPSRLRERRPRIRGGSERSERIRLPCRSRAVRARGDLRHRLPQLRIRDRLAARRIDESGLATELITRASR